MGNFFSLFWSAHPRYNLTNLYFKEQLKVIPPIFQFLDNLLYKFICIQKGPCENQPLLRLYVFEEGVGSTHVQYGNELHIP